MKKVISVVVALVGTIIISFASTKSIFPFLYHKVSALVVSPAKENGSTHSYNTFENTAPGSVVAADAAFAIRDQELLAPPCQPFDIQAVQISPNEKCDGGLDNGIAEAGLIPHTPLPADNMVGDWRFDGNLQDSESAGGNSRMKP